MQQKVSDDSVNVRDMSAKSGGINLNQLTDGIPVNSKRFGLAEENPNEHLQPRQLTIIKKTRPEDFNIGWIKPLPLTGEASCFRSRKSESEQVNQFQRTIMTILWRIDVGYQLFRQGTSVAVGAAIFHTWGVMKKFKHRRLFKLV